VVASAKNQVCQQGSLSEGKGSVRSTSLY